MTKILFADDSENTRGILRFMLQNQGFQLVEAVDGEDALAKAAAGRPDLIVLDGMMPKISGFDACLQLKADPKTASIPIILLSAVAQTDPNRDWAKETQADRFIAKPFQMRDLLGVIESLLGRPMATETSLRRKADLDPRPQGTSMRSRTSP